MLYAFFCFFFRWLAGPVFPWLKQVFSWPGLTSREAEIFDFLWRSEKQISPNKS